MVAYFAIFLSYLVINHPALFQITWPHRAQVDDHIAARRAAVTRKRSQARTQMPGPVDMWDLSTIANPHMPTTVEVVSEPQLTKSVPIATAAQRLTQHDQNRVTRALQLQ